MPGTDPFAEFPLGNNPLQVTSYPPFAGGMDTQSDVWTIPDDRCRYLVDALVDHEGELYRRGPVRSWFEVSTNVNFTPIGVCAVENPINGNLRLGVAYYNATNTRIELAVFDTAGTSKGTIALNSILKGNAPAFGAASPRPLFSASPAVDRGTIIGVATNYDHVAEKAISVLWYGSALPVYETGTITASAGVATVTGVGTTWTTNVEPGMFLFALTTAAGYAFLGVVRSVANNTTLLLEEPGARIACAAGSGYAISPIRPVTAEITTGLISTSTNSTAVTGSFTKWKEQKVAPDPNTDLYLLRRSDGIFVGASITSPTSNTSITLTANASQALTAEEYILATTSSGNVESYNILSSFIDDAAGSYNLTDSKGKVGWITAVHQDRPWYLNKPTILGDQTDRLWFGEPGKHNFLDPWSGYLDIGTGGAKSQPGFGLASTETALLVMKENQVWGIFGNAPTNYSPRHLDSVGCLGLGSIQTYKGGAVWASREGIMIWDNNEIVNATVDTIGNQLWHKLVEVGDFSPLVNRCYSALYNNHYLLHIEAVRNNVITITKGNTSTSFTKLTWALNLTTGAVSILTNLAFFGAILLPSEFGKEAVAVTEDADDDIHLINLDDLFDDSLGNDTLTTIGGTAGPDLYIESKAFDMGDPQRKKLFKQIQLAKKALTGSTLSLDTVPGLGETGSTSSTTFSTTSSFQNQRIKFLKRSQFLRFRMYQTDSNVTKVRLGPYAIGFKWQRVGKV